MLFLITDLIDINWVVEGGGPAPPRSSGLPDPSLEAARCQDGRHEPDPGHTADRRADFAGVDLERGALQHLSRRDRLNGFTGRHAPAK
jgi:hypothetical protein